MQFLFIFTSALILALSAAAPAAAQSAHKFDNDDIDVLPQFYDTKVAYMNRILKIQDTAIALRGVSNYDIFYDYCEERLDANWDERRMLRDYAESQEKSVDAIHARIDANEAALIEEVLKQLYKKSGLKATTEEEMIEALQPEISKHHRRAKEVMRRMLMHELVWHITDCKDALKKVEDNTAAADDFDKTYLQSYITLLAENDKNAKRIADKLMRAMPKPAAPKPKK